MGSLTALLQSIPEKVRGIIYVVVFTVLTLTAAVVTVLLLLGEIEIDRVSTVITFLLAFGTSGLAAANTQRK